MTFSKKTWTNRISEYITRRLLTKSDGSTEQVTVTRDEGEITQEGTPLNAATFNDLESRISDAFSATDTSISDINTHLTKNDTSISDINTHLTKTDKSITELTTPLPVVSLIPRWLRFCPSNKKALVIKAGTHIKNSSGNYVTFGTDTTCDLSSYISTNGADYFVYMDDNGALSAYTSKAARSGKVYIGRFHTLCANAGTLTMIAPYSPKSASTGISYLIKSYRQEDDADFYSFYNKTVTAVTQGTYYDVVTMAHPLSGFTAGSIIPESVFCLTWYPDCLKEDAMVYDKDTDIAVDVYLQSGTGVNTTSKYNATHTVSRQPYNHQEDMRMVGKKLLRDSQFTSMAIGSNERTNITGSSDKGTVGGHVDTASRRMISAIGVEEACGYIWQWLDEISSVGGSAWNASSDGQSNFGQEYGTFYVLRAGGYWDNGSYCGSRCRASNNLRSHVDAGRGARGSSLVAKHA